MYCDDLNGREIQKAGGIYAYIYLYMIHFAMQ